MSLRDQKASPRTSISSRHPERGCGGGGGGFSEPPAPPVEVVEEVSAPGCPVFAPPKPPRFSSPPPEPPEPLSAEDSWLVPPELVVEVVEADDEFELEAVSVELDGEFWVVEGSEVSATAKSFFDVVPIAQAPVRVETSVMIAKLYFFILSTG